MKVFSPLGKGMVLNIIALLRHLDLFIGALPELRAQHGKAYRRRLAGLSVEYFPVLTSNSKESNKPQRNRCGLLHLAGLERLHNCKELNER